MSQKNRIFPHLLEKTHSQTSRMKIQVHCDECHGSQRATLHCISIPYIYRHTSRLDLIIKENIFSQIMTGTESPASPTGVASIFKRVEQPAVQGWSPTLVGYKVQCIVYIWEGRQTKSVRQDLQHRKKYNWQAVANPKFSNKKRQEWTGKTPAQVAPRPEAEEVSWSLPTPWGRRASLGNSTWSNPCWSSWRRWRCLWWWRSTRQSPWPASTTCPTGRGWWGRLERGSESWDGQTWKRMGERALLPGKQAELLLKPTSCLTDIFYCSSAGLSGLFQRVKAGRWNGNWSSLSHSRKSGLQRLSYTSQQDHLRWM